MKEFIDCIIPFMHSSKIRQDSMIFRRDTSLDHKTLKEKQEVIFVGGSNDK